MRLAGFKAYLNHLLDRIDVDSSVFTEYILSLLEEHDDSEVVQLITDWLYVSTHQTSSFGTDHAFIALEISQKFKSICRDDFDDDADDDACIEECLRERGPDIYHTNVGLEDDENNYDDSFIDPNNNILEFDNDQNANHNEGWEGHDQSINHNEEWEGNCNENWTQGCNNNWNEHNNHTQAWAESEISYQNEYIGDGANYAVDESQQYDYQISENSAYGYGFNAEGEEDYSELLMQAINVKDCLQASHPSLAFSSTAIYTVLYECNGDIEQTANSIGLAYDEAAQCKPCRHRMTGKCHKRDCAFQHDVSTVTCRFWLLENGCTALSSEEGGSCIFQHKVFPLAPRRETEMEILIRSVAELQEESVTDVSSGYYPSLTLFPSISQNVAVVEGSTTLRYANALKGENTTKRRNV